MDPTTRTRSGDERCRMHANPWDMCDGGWWKKRTGRWFGGCRFQDEVMVVGKGSLGKVGFHPFRKGGVATPCTGPRAILHTVHSTHALRGWHARSTSTTVSCGIQPDVAIFPRFPPSTKGKGKGKGEGKGGRCVRSIARTCSHHLARALSRTPPIPTISIGRCRRVEDRPVHVIGRSMPPHLLPARPQGTTLKYPPDPATVSRSLPAGNGRSRSF